MTYWRLFYHIVWATKNREPSISSEARHPLYNAVAAKARQLGAAVHAIGGTEDHIHVVASVPPTITLSEFVRNLKGGSSHLLNHQLSLPRPFGWQSEYGVLSFDDRLRERMIQYVKDQRQHHQDGTTVPVLERTAAEERAPKDTTIEQHSPQPL